MEKKLFIPGPTKVHPDVLAKMGTPMIGHRTAEASALQRSITEKLRKLLSTQSNKILLSTSSGTGLMEGAIRCSTSRRAIVFSTGAFGKRWHELAVLNGVPVDIHEADPGQPVMPDTVDSYLKTGKYDTVAFTHSETSTGVMCPLEMYADVIGKYSDIVWMADAVSSMGGVRIDADKSGIDIIISASQKALALPPGLAIACVSEKAEKRFAKVGPKGYYLDFGTLCRFIEKRNHQYSSTPSLSHMFALDFQLDRMEKEGFENRYIRHIEMAEYMINWVNNFFRVYPQPGFEAITVTVVENNRGINVPDFIKALNEKNFTIANGYGDLKDKTFRIGHMGETTIDELMELTAAMEEILNIN